MTYRNWLLVFCGGLALLGPAYGQTAAPDAAGAAAPALTLDPMRGLILPRVTPTAPQSQQSPEAERCANADGKVAAAARAEACGKLIESGRWKGEEIAWAYSNRCFALKKMGQADKALADCDKAIELDGKNAVAFQVRGMILQDRSDSERARADFDKAVELGGKNPALFSDRGNLLLAAGEADKAIADYSAVIDIEGKSASAFVARGGAWLAKGEWDKALADYSRAIELAPNDAFAIFNRGVAYQLKGDKANAVAAFKQALKVDPKSAYPALWLFLAQSGAEAKAELKSRAAKVSQTAWPWPVVRYDLGDITAAQVLAAANAPGDKCEAHFYIGAELLGKNARDEAVAHLREAVETCPKNFIEYFRAVATLKALGVEIPKPAANPAKAEPAAPEAPAADKAPAVLDLKAKEPEKTVEPAKSAEPEGAKAVEPAPPAASEPPKAAPAETGIGAAPAAPIEEKK